MSTLNAVHRIRVIQGTSTRIVTGCRADSIVATLASWRIPLNDFMVGNMPVTGTPRSNFVSTVVADDGRRVPVFPGQTQTLLDGKEKFLDGTAIIGDIDQHRLLVLSGNDGVRPSVLAVEVAGHVDGILFASVTDGAALFVGSEIVGALRAVACVTLKFVHHIEFVVVRFTDDQDGILRVLKNRWHGA